MSKYHRWPFLPYYLSPSSLYLHTGVCFLWCVTKVCWTGVLLVWSICIRKEMAVSTKQKHTLMHNNIAPDLSIVLLSAHLYNINTFILKNVSNNPVNVSFRCWFCSTFLLYVIFFLARLFMQAIFHTDDISHRFS